MKSVYCGIDDFALGLDELLGDITPGIQREMARRVPKAAKEVKRLTVENAKNKGWDGVTGKRYVSGFGMTVTKTGVITEAQVGNRTTPGLVHLLEKGHNTLGGDRVPGKPHMGPAFDLVKEKYFKDVLESVGKVLRG